MADGKVLYEVRADNSKLSADLNEADAKAKSGANKIASTVAAAAIGAAFVAAGKKAIEFGATFESSMAKASTLYGDVTVDTVKLNDKMLELSSSANVDASQLGESLYNALSAGVPATEDMGDALAYLEKNARLAKAGFTDIDTASSATIKTLNAYGLGIEDTDRIQKILMQTQNKGIVTVGELGSVLSQVTPTASAMGVSFEEVGAGIANMTAQGTPAAQATTQLNSLFAELGKEGTKASKSLNEATKGTKYAGKGFQELVSDGVPLNEILDLMGNYAEENGVGMLDMFSSIEAGKAALANGGENSQKFADALNAMSTETDVVGEAFDKVTDTNAEKFSKAMNDLKNIGISLYLNALQPLIAKLFELVQWLRENETAAKIIGIAILTLTAAIIGYNIALNIATITTGIATTATAAFGAVMAFITSPVTLVILAIGALIAIGVLLAKNWDKVSEALVKGWEWIKETAQKIASAIGNFFKAGFDSVKNAVSSMTDSIKEKINNVKKVFNEIISFIKNVFTGNWRSAWQNVKNIFSSILSGLGNIFKSPLNFIIDGINRFTRGLSKIKIPSWVPGVGGKGINIPSIPRLKVGMDYVPEDDFPAVLHRGEAVLTAEENNMLRSIGGIGALHSLLSGQRLNPQSNNIIIDSNQSPATSTGITIQELYVRNDSDIDKIANKLYKLQQRKLRGKGGNV